MRTKYLLFSTILAAAAVSSCSNEELVENPGIATGGEKVAISITAQKGDGTSTRAGIDVAEDGKLGPQFWEASDKLGGLLYAAVDGAAMLTNYPFVPTDMGAFENGGKPTSMSFKTPTAVSKGTYVFYTPYATEHVGNEKFEVELSDRQEMDPANPSAHMGKYNFMIAPAISLKGIEYGEEGAVNNLPIQFRSIYNLTRISIKLDKAKAPVTIQRIVIRDGADAALKTKSQIVPSKINALVNAVAEDWSADKTDILTTNGELNAAKAVSSDYQQAAKALEVSTGHVEQIDGASAIVLAVKGGKTLAAGETFDAYVLLPAGAYTSGLKYDIYTDKGVSGQEIATADLKVLTAAKSKKISCTLNYTEGDNNIELPMTFDIASAQDWTDAVSYVTTNFGAYGNTTNWKTPTFNLLKDAKGTLPANFKIKVTTGTNKLTLEGNNTLNAVTYDLTAANIINDGVLTIAGGTTSTPNEWTVESLVNNKTITVGATAKLTTTTTLENLGDLTNAGEILVTTATTNGKTDGTVVGTITNTGKFTATTALTNNKKSTINVNKTAKTTLIFTLSAASTSFGAINIADGAKLTASAALTNNGVITLTNAANLDGGTALDNDKGTIVITDPSKGYNLTIPASGKSGIIKTTVSTLAGIKAAQGKVDATTANKLINTIELTSSIKLEDDLNLGAATDLSLAAGVKLEVAKDKTVTCKTLIASGAGASVAPYDEDDDAATAKVTAAALDVKENASLTIAKYLTVGDACVALTVGKTATLTNNGDIKANTATETEVTVKVLENGSFINSKDATMNNAKLKITTNAGVIKNLNTTTAIKVGGSMVGKMEGNFNFGS